MVNEQCFTKDIELLAISMQPYYLPRGLLHGIVITAPVPLIKSNQHC